MTLKNNYQSPSIIIENLICDDTICASLTLTDGVAIKFDGNWWNAGGGLDEN